MTIVGIVWFAITVTVFALGAIAPFLTREED
jgi:hypothetical protein